MNKQGSTVEIILPVYFSVSLTALNGTRVTDIEIAWVMKFFLHPMLFYLVSFFVIK